MDVLPAHLSGLEHYDGGAFGNVRLRVGEVQAIYWPTDDKNISKTFVEYDVFVQHRSSGTAASKMYNHCIALDRFGGLADTGTSTYRPDPAAARKNTKREPVPGQGSKVLLLCINGENHNAVIIGGIRDMNADKDVKEAGHHLHWRFNGIDLSISKDGELVLEYQGAQKADGSLEDSVDQAATGTTITISKNGNVEIADAVQDGDDVVAKNIILLDHENNKVQVTADSEVDVIAPTVKLGGTDADEPLVMGNEWADLMGKLFDLITQITVITAVGTSTPPVNTPAFQVLKATIQQRLSRVSSTK